MTSDVIPDDNNVMPTDEELVEMICDEINETLLEDAKLEAAEQEPRWLKIDRPEYMD
jgi:hypothetical protein